MAVDVSRFKSGQFHRALEIRHRLLATTLSGVEVVHGVQRLAEMAWRAASYNFSATIFSASKTSFDVVNASSASYAIASNGLCRYPKHSKPFA